MGTASGRSAFRRNAASRVLGVNTSTGAKRTSPSWENRLAVSSDLSRRLAVARGDEPADVVVRGGRVLSVFTREWLDVDIAIADGWIAGLGEYDGREVVDASGRYVVPGFLDAHMHLESTKLLPDEFARLVLPLGTTAVVLDPHELANVLGKDLNAYVASGIRSDHEALTMEEGRERLRSGMWLLIREASMARNLQALLPLVREFGTNRIAFCTDDRDPEDIAENGHINGMVREAVATGVSPEDAVVLATLNPATWHRLWHLGAIAPGYQADLLLLPDLERFEPELTLKSGRPVEEIPQPEVPEWVKHSVRNHPVTEGDLRIPWEGGDARVIGLVPDQIVTDNLVQSPTSENGMAVADADRDLAKIAVIERHLGTGRVGLGFVHGSGLARGALASTVAHDAHNIVVVGMKDGDMVHAVQRLGELGGGIVVVDDGKVTSELPLPVAGLLADAPLAQVIAQSL